VPLLLVRHACQVQNVLQPWSTWYDNSVSQI
jgi:hypothetical protein